TLWVMRTTAMVAPQSTRPPRKTAHHGGAQRSAVSCAWISIVPGPSVPRRRCLLEPARFADVDRDVGQRAARPGTVPVLLIRFDPDGIPHTDSLGGGTPSLNPAGPIDDVEELTALVGVPVVTRAWLEANNDGRCGECRLLRREQIARSRPPGEMSWVQRLEVGARPVFRCDLHAATLPGCTTGVSRHSVPSAQLRYDRRAS